MVPALAGPFDFVFSDADKDWYNERSSFCELQLLLSEITPDTLRAIADKLDGLAHSVGSRILSEPSCHSDPVRDSASPQWYGLAGRNVS